MKQTLCDRCGDVIDPNEVLGGEQITYVGVGTGHIENARWREYHRRCAREATVAEVWARPGVVPL